MGFGTVIPHYGTIVVGTGNKIGNYAVLHTGICITAGKKIIGNGFYCSTGAKILNDVCLGDYISVGANAVVNTSFPDGNLLLIGVPAKEKREEQPWYISDGGIYTKRQEMCEELKSRMGLNDK